MKFKFNDLQLPKDTQSECCVCAKERRRANASKKALATFQVIVVSCLYCSVDPKRERVTYTLCMHCMYASMENIEIRV